MIAMRAETSEQAIIRKMVALYPRTHGPECADKYRAKAEWWMLHSELSAVPDQAVQYASNQAAIAADMEARPWHHQVKPLEFTRYQWSLQR